MEKDLSKIAARAEANWADNWNYRAYLQRHVPPDEIDRTAQALNREVASAIDCTTCTNCCREINPYLSSSDVRRVAQSLGLKSTDLRKQYLRKEGSGAFVFRAKPCPMLQTSGACAVYQDRPDDCREYPHLHKPDFLSRSIGFIENYRICPIVYNVYERMKSAFAYDPSTDYIGDTDPEETHGSLLANNY